VNNFLVSQPGEKNSVKLDLLIPSYQCSIMSQWHTSCINITRATKPCYGGHAEHEKLLEVIYFTKIMNLTILNKNNFILEYIRVTKKIFFHCKMDKNKTLVGINIILDKTNTVVNFCEVNSK